MYKSRELRRGLSMDPSEKDRQIRAAIDEYHEAIEDRARVAKDVQRWQQENPHLNNRELLKA